MQDAGDNVAVVLAQHARDFKKGPIAAAWTHGAECLEMHAAHFARPWRWFSRRSAPWGSRAA
jgi:hypothetical protein